MATLLLCGQCETVPHIDLDHEYALVHGQLLVQSLQSHRVCRVITEIDKIIFFFGGGEFMLFFSTLFNTASSAACQPVLPTGRMFGRITQKGPSKKVSGLTNQRPI
jgi:hypothetical protein